MKIKIEAIVEAESFDVGDMYRLVPEQGFWFGGGSECVIVSSKHVTEIPELIEHGAMVWAWDRAYPDEGMYGVYISRHTDGGVLIARNGTRMEDKTWNRFDACRLATQDDLQAPEPEEE